MEKLYSPKEAAEILGVSRKTILRRIKDGTIRAFKVGYRTIKISESAIKEMLAECENSK